MKLAVLVATMKLETVRMLEARISQESYKNYRCADSLIQTLHTTNVQIKAFHE